VAYVGVSSPTYGTLTVFRQNALTMDAVFAYDPMGASYAFSPLGFQGTTCGVGDTEDCRYSASLKYRVNVGMFRVAGLWQFGGYGRNNASDGAYQAQVGADIHKLANDVLSVDAIYSYVRDAVSASLTGNPTNANGPTYPAADSAIRAAVSHGDNLNLSPQTAVCCCCGTPSASSASADGLPMRWWIAAIRAGFGTLCSKR
jgi:predicted porin